MSRTRDAGLAVGLLGVAILFAVGVGAAVELAWLLAGGAVTILLEGLAYRQPTVVQEQFERRAVLVGSLLLAAAGIAAGAMLAPDRALSLAVGGLGTYLCLLGVVAVTGWSPSRSV